MADLSITNVVNVFLNEPQAGISEYKVNNLAIFTKTQPLVSMTDGYAIYKDSISVGNDFGTTSEVFEQAVAIFSQSPNILSANGDLVVIPMLLNQPATAGKFETSDIFANISAITAIDDGEFTIAIDGGASANITGLDFTSAENLTDIAGVIDAKLTGAVATADILQGKIIITSEFTGSSSSIEITAYTGGTGTDISGATLFDFENATETIGRALGDETILEAIVRTQNLVFYFGILSTENMLSEMPGLSNYIQSLRKLIFFPQNSTTALNYGGAFYNVKNASNTHTRCLLFTTGAEESRLMASAYASKGFGMNFNANNSNITMNLKDLATILPDPNITQTIKQKCDDLGVDIYSSIAGIPKVFSFGANRYFDSVYSELALISDLEVELFNALAKVSTKIPQTESGMEILKGAVRNIMNKYIINGYLASGTWTSADTFGNPEDLKRNILDFGFYIYSQPINQQLQVDREARKSPVIQVAYKEAGAIHSTILNLFRNA